MAKTIPHPPIARGEKNGRAKLTDEIVRAARARYRSTPRNPADEYAAMAREFGVSRYVMRAAVRGKTWGHVA